MRTLAFLLALTVAAIAVAAPPNPSEVAPLVEKLGSNEFAEREAATKQLEELGEPALAELRAACMSENPEIADRAKELVRKIERRISSDKALAPTVVELDAKDTPLDEVLAAISKQAKCEVVLGGLKPEELAAKKVTIATGKVPFWVAVLKVCDAADLQIAVVGNFVAPGAMPYRPQPGAKFRVAPNVNAAVVLEARDSTKKRPASVHGAVLVEAFEAPKSPTPSTPAALLQFWPEPKLAWQSVANMKITKATDSDGRRLTPDLTPAAWIPERMGRPGLGRGPSSGPGPAPGPNVRQAIVKFKPGDEPTKLVRELTGSAFVVVRMPPEPLATVTLDPKKAVAVTGPQGVEMTATLRVADGKKFVDVKLIYPASVVEPAQSFVELTGVKSGPNGWNRTIVGLSLTDAAGDAFELSLPSQRADFDPIGRLVIVQMTLAPVTKKDGPTEPAKVAFWGTIPKQVEVPFALKDVPLR